MTFVRNDHMDLIHLDGWSKEAVNGILALSSTGLQNIVNPIPKNCLSFITCYLSVIYTNKCVVKYWFTRWFISTLHIPSHFYFQLQWQELDGTSHGLWEFPRTFLPRTNCSYWKWKTPLCYTRASGRYRARILVPRFAWSLSVPTYAPVSPTLCNVSPTLCPC